MGGGGAKKEEKEEKIYLLPNSFHIILHVIVIKINFIYRSLNLDRRYC